VGAGTQVTDNPNYQEYSSSSEDFNPSTKRTRLKRSSCFAPKSVHHCALPDASLP
jgi:hypothetical protein